MAVNESALLRDFLIESYDGINSIKSLLIEIEKNPSDAENINNLFRIIHTLKGSASFLGFIQLKNLAHSIEGLLDSLRKGKTTFNSDVYDILSESFDLTQAVLKQIEDTKSEAGIEIDATMTKLDLFLEMAAMSSGQSTPIVASDEVAIMMEEAPITAPTPAPAATIAPIPVITEPTYVLSQTETQDNFSTGADGKKSASVADSIVKVNVQLLDQIMNVIGELVVNRNQILQYTGKFDDFELQKLTHQLDVITGELQNDIMSTRMQPVGQVLNKFERIVRDFSKTLGKKIQLVITGQETELDKTLIEAIKDPLTHLVRNAVDHGIEMPDDRIKAKKNEVASLKLKAFHENGKVSIKIQDDGKGIDHIRIKDKAIEKGIITKDEADRMGVKDLVNLIFSPGFSTAEKITDISGRGVGMDVVKTNIERIGGEIDIQTVKGLGTTITLRIPLTLAIIPSLTVSSNNKVYCIPQLNVIEFVLVDLSQETNSFHKMHGVNFFRLREKLIPIYSLSKILEDEKLSNTLELNESQLMNLVIVSGDGQEYGLVVDAIYDIEEIVVKPLSKSLKNLEYYSGATVMGNGEIALILETSTMIKQINPNRVRNEGKLDGIITKSATNDVTRDFLIFSLRDNKNYGLLLSFIERIDEINTSEIKYNGGKAFLKYRDQVVPLIDVQHCIDRKPASKIETATVQILVVNVQSHLVGLIVNNVFDSLTIMNEIDAFANNHPALAGTVFVENEPILIVNLTKVLSTINIKIGDKDNKKKLFHVDDSKIHRSILKDIIDTEFPELFEIVAFPGPPEFLAYLKKNSELVKESTILITDIDMPNMNGWEMIQEIASSYSKLKFLTLSLTSRAHHEDIERSKELGILHHLIKFNKKSIVNSINYVLGWDTPQVVSESINNGIDMLDQFCGFRIGKESYAIPIVDIQEVVSTMSVSSVPKSSDKVRGLINLRGQIVTSISLRDVFKYDPTQPVDQMNIIVRHEDGLASLMIDEILDVMSFDEKQRANLPENISEDIRKYFDCVYKEPNELITIVNVNTILQDVL